MKEVPLDPCIVWSGESCNKRANGNMESIWVKRYEFKFIMKYRSMLFYSGRTVFYTGRICLFVKPVVINVQGVNSLSSMGVCMQLKTQRLGPQGALTSAHPGQ